MELKFEKYNGLGNDFIIIDKEIAVKDIIRLCDRRFGIGADGLVILDRKADMYFMRFFNQDGTVASMCGNGIRCYTHYLYNKKLIEKDKIVKINTLAGVKKVRILNDDDFTIKVAMGNPKNLKLHQKIKIDDLEFNYHYVNTGVDHIVIYLKKEDFTVNYVNEYGMKIQNRKDVFPNGININFCYINDFDNIEVMTYERGVGLTFACGTGACACVFISNKLNLTTQDVKVKLLGGSLEIALLDEIYMSGKSEFVYKGSIEI